MISPKNLLEPKEYKNYRNVRAASYLFVLIGCLIFLGGIGVAVEDSEQSEMPRPVAVGFAVVGLAGAVGGVAALRGNRRWARLVYVMAALYVFGFPIGTLLSIAMFRGLSGYLDSVERIKAVTSKPF